MLESQVRPTFIQDFYIVTPPAWADGATPEVCAVGYGDFVSRSSYVWDTAHDGSWRLYWIESGEGFVQTDDGRRQWLRAGDFFAMVPNRAYHREDLKNNPWRHRFLMLRGTRVEEALRLAGLAPNEVHHRPGLVDTLDPVFSKMRTELLRDHPSLSMLCALAHECLALCEPKDPGRGDVARRGKKGRDELTVEWLRQHYARGATIEDAAKATGVSRSWLFRAFRKHTGQNPKAYLDHLRVEHARRLLAIGGYRLKEIAALSGFSDTQHFVRTFTRKTGAKPSESAEEA